MPEIKEPDKPQNLEEYLEEKKIYTIEKGTAKLAGNLLSDDNEGGNIRDAILLEPLNSNATERFSRMLLEEIKGEADLAGNTWDKIELATTPISKIRPKNGNELYSDFISNYLKEYYSNFRNGILLLRSDLANYNDISELGPYILAVVENQPHRELINYCLNNNVKLIFVYDEHDLYRILEQGKTLGPNIRPLVPSVKMIDTTQVDDVASFIRSREVPPDLKEKWTAETRKLTQKITRS